MAFLANLQHVVTLLVILSILVVAHEWGHFIVARIFGIRVDDFSIGFGKRLVRLGKRGDTEYNLRMLPLGGFVKIAGMAADEEPLVRAKDQVLGIGDKTDRDAAEIPLIAENVETNSVDHVPAPDEFGSKALWQRALVILAGPVMSFILGYVVLCLMGWTVGTPTGKPLTRIGLVEPGGEGQKIGLRAGDTILAINGQPVSDGFQMTSLIHNSLGKPLTLTVRRGDQTLTKTGTPRPELDEDNKPITFVSIVTPRPLGQALGLLPGDDLGQINAEDVRSAAQARTLLQKSAGKTITVAVLRHNAEVDLKQRTPFPLPLALLPTLREYQNGIFKIEPAEGTRRVSLAQSVRQGNLMLLLIYDNLRDMLQRHKLQNSTGGIIYMYQATTLADKNGPVQVVSLLAQLSISLAIFNLLPIPILDGGHLLAFFIEWVRRGKKMTEQQQQAFLMTGLAVIGVLFVLIMTKDILRTIQHQLPQ